MLTLYEKTAQAKAGKLYCFHCVNFLIVSVKHFELPLCMKVPMEKKKADLSEFFKGIMTVAVSISYVLLYGIFHCLVVM